MQISDIPKTEPYVYNYRRRLPPDVYEDNYSYAMNYYQPMIDYLDAKERGEKRAPPNLPWLCERGFSRYDTHKPVPKYPESRIPQLTKRAEEEAKEYLPDYRAYFKRTPFSVRQTAEASRLGTHIKEVSFLERMEKRLQERNQKLEHYLKKERDTRVKQIEKQLKDAYLKDEPVEFPTHVKEALRGQRADKITKILLDDSSINQKKKYWINEEAVRQYRVRQEQVRSEARTFGESTAGKWAQRNLQSKLDVIKGALDDYYKAAKELEDVSHFTERSKRLRPVDKHLILDI